MNSKLKSSNSFKPFFLDLLLNLIFENFKDSKDTRTARVIPPAPRTSTSFFLFLNFFKHSVTPSTSVLYPINLLPVLTIVFTAPALAA